jgi:hypothetical protein
MKRAEQNPFVLYIRTQAVTQDYAECNGRTGEGSILQVATNTDNIPALSAKVEENHKDF